MRAWRLFRPVGCRYADPAAFLMPDEPWQADRHELAITFGRIHRQLNKQQNINWLEDQIFYGNDGKIRLHSLDRQSTQAAALALVVNAIIAWNTVYTQRVLDELRGGGELITSSEIEHISPLPHQHIHLYGHYPFDLASRPDGHRPLRTPAPQTSAPSTPNRV